LAYQYEEPFADASSVVTYMISKLAREHVTVILNGDGGDELFAGYDRYKRLKRDAMVDEMKYLHPLMHFGAKHIDSKNKWLNQVDRFLEKAKLPLADRFVTYNCYFTNEEKKRLYSLSQSTSLRRKRTLSDLDFDLNLDSYSLYRNKFDQSHALDPRDSALFADLTTYLPDDLLVKVDIASMANSLEARSPILDHQFVELACKMDFDLKVRGFGKNAELKYIFKKALEPLVPKENLYRPKRGFSIPLSKWFSGDLNKYTKSVLLNKNAKTKELLNQSEIKRMLEAHSEEKDFGPKLWSLLTLELWFQSYF